MIILYRYKKTKKNMTDKHNFLGLIPIRDVEFYHKQLLIKLEYYFLSYEQLNPLKGSLSE